MKRIRFFNDLLTEKFGSVLHRIPFDLGLSCPNRVNGPGPCAFCAADGARARHLVSGMELRAQAEAGKAYVRERYRSEGPYLAYCQAFTSTFAPVEVLRRLYSEALAAADFRALVIATRPDCLSEECLDYLCELKERYELWLEIGVQTANDRTLTAINRGHDFACVEDAVRRAHSRGIHCAAHLILGLPGETESDFLATAGRIAALPFEAVKMHHLLILRGTPMAKMLHENRVHPLNEYEYAAALAGFLRRLPDSMCVMRLSADAPEEQVLAPRWWMKKGQFREMFLDFFNRQEDDPAPFRFACRTDDGSYTFYHPVFRQHFQERRQVHDPRHEKGFRRRFRCSEIFLLRQEPRHVLPDPGVIIYRSAGDLRTAGCVRLCLFIQQIQMSVPCFDLAEKLLEVAPVSEAVHFKAFREERVHKRGSCL